MTKMNLNLGAKPATDNGDQTLEGVPKAEKQPQPQPDTPRPDDDYCGEAHIDVQAVYAVPTAYTGIDWRFIWRIGHIQFFLSMLSSLCLLLSLHYTGFNVFRFTSSAWSTYLACVSVVAIRAGRQKNYPYLIAFTGMVTFQTVIYMSSLCWLAYSLYALDYQMNFAHRGVYAGRFNDLALCLIVCEILSLLLTVFTGLFGLIAACRGLGKMLQDMESFILETRYPAPQITVRPLV